MRTQNLRFPVSRIFVFSLEMLFEAESEIFILMSNIEVSVFDYLMSMTYISTKVSYIAYWRPNSALFLHSILKFQYVLKKTIFLSS